MSKPTYPCPANLNERSALDRRLHDEAVGNGRALTWAFAEGDNISAATSYVDSQVLVISHRYRIDWTDATAYDAPRVIAVYNVSGPGLGDASFGVFNDLRKAMEACEVHLIEIVQHPAPSGQSAFLPWFSPSVPGGMVLRG